LIILIWNQFEKGRMTLVVILAMAILLILFIQPDASQLTAFGLPIIVIFYKKLKPLSLFIICSIFVTIMIAISWILLDSLAPVEYVEDIMLVVKDMGLIWLFLGILSLIMMIMPFIVFSDKKYCLLSRLIGLYFAITIISTYFGNFPMPIMGYGVSPVIGYQVAITWLFKTRLKI
jgi:hypothetical protein